MLPVALKAAGAAAAGAIVVLAVAAGSTGALPAGAGWAAAAGAFACVSGLVLGTGGRRAPAAAFAAAAITALVIAPTGREEVRAAPRVLAMKAPADSERLRGDASAASAESERLRGDVSARLEALVRDYYADLDARRYDAAWARLAPAVRRGFGGFDAWRSGYRTTVGHAVEDLAVTGRGVTHTLVARCGRASGRYAVRWRFAGAQAVDVTAEALSGTAC